ncbi:MAG: DUF4136 domain-containing protein [Halopseudomonas sp.]
MRYLLTIIVLTIGLSGCDTLSVSSHQDPYADLSEYKTFNWVTELPDSQPDDTKTLKEKKFRSLVERELASRGIPRSRSNPDMLVGYHPQKSEHGTRAVTHGYNATYYDWIAYTEGSLAIDFIDTQSKEIVWHATIYGIIDQADPQGQLKKAVLKALDLFFNDAKS